MSKIKVALVSVLLASSTAAMAAPSVSFSASAQLSLGTSISGPIVRDHRGDSWNQPANPMPSTTWISLAAPLRLASGRDVIKPQLGNYSQVRLQAESGTMFVQKVTVRYTDGALQTKTFNQWLMGRNTLLQFDVLPNHRQIDSITVQGTAAGRGASYEVFAQGTRVALPRPPIPTDGYHVVGGYIPQPPVYQPPVYQPQGLMLANGIDFAHTDGRRFITVGADKGAFNTIHIQGTSGTSYIQMVLVNFTDGTTQFLNGVSKNLRAGESVDLSLDGTSRRQINQITIWTNENGTPVDNATGSFSVTAL